MDQNVEAGPSVPPTESAPKPEDKKPEEKKPEDKKPEVKKTDKPKRSESLEKKGSKSVSARPSRSDQKLRIKWRMTTFCDLNIWYLVRMRGIMNLIHLVLCLALIFLLGHACQLRPAADRPSQGFFCKPPEVFLFITACAAFFNSLIFLICCLFSKRSDSVLFQTPLEASYYILYFILFLAASITLLISIIRWGKDRIFFNSNYASLQTIAIVGLVAGCCYGISTLWFFVSHQLYASEIIIENNEVVDNLVVANDEMQGNPANNP